MPYKSLEDHRACKRRSYQKHKDRLCRISREYYKKNIEKCKEYNKKYTKKNRHKRNAYFNNKYRNDVQFKILINLKNNLRSAIRKYDKTGKISKSKNSAIDYKSIIEHLKPFPDISKFSIDHIIPLSAFDLTNINDVKIAFAPTNHQWLTISENASKGCKY